MKIETKFDIGQQVWFIFFGSIYTTILKDIQVKTQGNLLIIEYEDRTHIFTEDELCATREEAEARLKEMQDEVC